MAEEHNYFITELAYLYNDVDLYDLQFTSWKKA